MLIFLSDTSSLLTPSLYTRCLFPSKYLLFPSFKMSFLSAAAVMETLTRYDSAVRKAIAAGDVHTFMKTEGDSIVSHFL